MRERERERERERRYHEGKRDIKGERDYIMRMSRKGLGH